MEFPVPLTKYQFQNSMFVLPNVPTGVTSHPEVLILRILKILLHKMYGNSWLVKKVQILKMETFP